MTHFRHTLAALAFAAVLPAWADRPLVSETADVIGAGECQLESWAARAKASGSPSAHGETAFVSCGVGGHHQFGLLLDQARADGATARAVTLFGKTTIVAPDKGKPGFGVSYTLGFEKLPGEGLRREAATVLGVATLEIAEGTIVHGNVGWAHSRSARQSTTNWSLGVEHGSDFTVAADVFGDDRERPWISAGVGYSLIDALSVNAAYAVQFVTPRVRVLSVGLKFKF